MMITSSCIMQINQICSRMFTTQCTKTNLFRQKIVSAFSVVPNRIKQLSTSYSWNDTIYALSSGFGKCGVAVIRVSGEHTKDVVKKLTGLKCLPKPRKAFVSTLKHPNSGILLDRALVLWFSKPSSFTGEDVCEFQIHGGPAVIASVLDALSCFKGLRSAEAGDFTKRAFLNNKLDFTEVEGLGDLIHAETEAQRRQAFHQMEGSLSTLYRKWSNSLLKSTAHLEAFIDFSEDENLDDELHNQVKVSVKQVLHDIQSHLSDKRRGEILRNGVRIAIIGQPNVGKSSLMNAIIQRPAAIVSPIAGTTRDVIDTTLDIDGYPVIISDTAGITESNDIVEKEGISRAYQRAQQADLIIFMLNADHVQSKTNLDTFLCQHASKLNVEDKIADQDNILIALNKIDLLDTKKRTSLMSQSVSYPFMFMSCQTQEGFSEFMENLSRKVKHLCGSSSIGEIPSVTQQRHRNHLLTCCEYLNEYLKFSSNDVVISAEYLRMALNEIGKISGKVGAEDILDVIFKDFCIGK